MKDTSKATSRQRRLHMLSTGHASDALNEAERTIASMREALEAARTIISHGDVLEWAGGDAHTALAKIDAALATAEGKVE